MRVFLTGATGFIGSHILPELLEAGHQVLGLTRSDAGARALAAAGAEAHLGTLEDTDSLREGAARADAVIHTAFDHDFSNFAANCEKDGRAIAALGSALKGTDRPILITSAVGMGATGPGEAAREDVFDAHHPSPRIASERAGAALSAEGVNVSVIRLPQVHDTAKQGLVSPYIELSKAKGVAAYVGDGLNRWSAAHVVDVARLYRLAMEKAQPGTRYHASAEEGVPVREIAEVVSAGLGVPTVSLSPQEAGEHFGWLALFAGWDMLTSSAWTRKALGWEPRGPGLIADLRNMDYSVVGAAHGA
ncbi:SDR family oxidoreductase [Consotaella salsifontis]|uniref:Nucleoside-diphosphate-sugar epimerase n=1 Tax=Consotaella salsifontis TaxID=1365950 RepID=A0A1T4SU98_9HYPH|nr:SDR family oxidoreductase [Consotaella salsifontis]SKA31835.1 Nucleoside-diphosphate-sugar epimerase [Consotaella salsifontis]